MSDLVWLLVGWGGTMAIVVGWVELHEWRDRRTRRRYLAQPKPRFTRAQVEEMVGLPIPDWQWQRMCDAIPDEVVP